jgi:hypothetical protein
MSRPIAPIECDGPGCGKRKQETNRWWTVEEWSIGVARLAVIPGTSIDPGVEGCDLYDFCGQTCALKFLSERMSKVTS